MRRVRSRSGGLPMLRVLSPERALRPPVRGAGARLELREAAADGGALVLVRLRHALLVRHPVELRERGERRGQERTPCQATDRAMRAPTGRGRGGVNPLRARLLLEGALLRGRPLRHLPLLPLELPQFCRRHRHRARLLHLRNDLPLELLRLGLRLRDVRLALLRLRRGALQLLPAALQVVLRRLEALLPLLLLVAQQLLARHQRRRLLLLLRQRLVRRVHLLLRLRRALPRLRLARVCVWGAVGKRGSCQG